MNKVDTEALTQDINLLWPAVRKRSKLPDDNTVEFHKYPEGCYLSVFSPRIQNCIYTDDIDLGRENLAQALEGLGYVIVRGAPNTRCVVGKQ